MRYLFIKAQQELFAHKLGAYLLFRLIAYHIVREKLRAFLSVLFKLCKKLVYSLAVFGRHRDYRVKIMSRGIQRHDLQKLCFFNRVDLVYNKDRRNSGFLYASYKLFLLPADIRYRLNEQHNGVNVDNALLYDIDHIIAKARSRLVEARSVDYNKLCVAAVDNGADAVARGLRLI